MFKSKQPLNTKTVANQAKGIRLTTVNTKKIYKLLVVWYFNCWKDEWNRTSLTSTFSGCPMMYASSFANELIGIVQ